MCINFSPALQGGGGREGGGKPPGEDTKSLVAHAHADGPDNVTRPKGHHSGQG